MLSPGIWTAKKMDLGCWWVRAGHALSVCAGIRNQLCPGLIPPCEQQERDWDCVPVPPEVRAQLQSWDPAQEDVELVERAQRRQQDEQRDGAALLGAKAGRAGIVQPGQEKLWAELRVALQGLKEHQETWRETIPKGCRDRECFHYQR
ncbi:hypothetical protein DUI87_15583 [Hirundo rustica rustica]|uniref:Uncharacterized protein n=1 Tax=Hirundo rustica rustica TaxID=333673 RepID=A0A3M0JZ05_HIRRU|nr:hypothetical protein DUI87_15583 [Hirundo rustica rustica]